MDAISETRLIDSGQTNSQTIITDFSSIDPCLIFQSSCHVQEKHPDLPSSDFHFLFQHVRAADNTSSSRPIHAKHELEIHVRLCQQNIEHTPHTKNE